MFFLNPADPHPQLLDAEARSVGHGTMPCYSVAWSSARVTFTWLRTIIGALDAFLPSSLDGAFTLDPPPPAAS